MKGLREEDVKAIGESLTLTKVDLKDCAMDFYQAREGMSDREVIVLAIQVILDAHYECYNGLPARDAAKPA